MITVQSDRSPARIKGQCLAATAANQSTGKWEPLAG
jgi:hypothetical protein